MDVDDLCLDAVFCQHLSSCQGFRYHETGGYDGQILAFPEGNALADLKFVIRTVIDHRCSQTAETEINRSYILVSGFYCCFCLDIITRIDDNHARNDAHQSDILVALMGCSVLTYGKTGVSCTDFHIQMGIADGVSHLLKSTAGRKHGEGAHEGNLSRSGKTGCDACHIALGDTAVDVTLRKYLLKHTGLGSLSKVSVQNHKIFMLFAQLYQGISVTLSGSDLLYF